MAKKMVHQKIISKDSSEYSIQDNNIIYLGIQGPPGICFSLNESIDGSNNILMIGATGVFELDLENTSAYISKIEFEENIISNLIKNGQKAHIIIDYVTLEDNGTTSAEGGVN